VRKAGEIALEDARAKGRRFAEAKFRLQRAALEGWLANESKVAVCACEVEGAGSSPPLSRPPGVGVGSVNRLAQRGVIGLLSDLGTFLE
jgi:hypothetical protein